MEIKNIYGHVIKTIEGDNLQKADLQGADLTGADLRGADLTGADLRRADLREADLRGADLRGADFRGARLQWARLQVADLRGADLRGADLRGARMPMYCKWTHSIIDGKIQIGCEIKSIEDWDAFFASDQRLSTPRGTAEFKQIEAVYLAYRAYLNHLTATPTGEDVGE